jgi:RNase P subunit RPR2
VTDYNSDQGRELRRARLTVIRPTNAPDILSNREFDITYKQFHVVRREVMTDTEESGKVMFCPACHEQVDDTLVAVRKLYVTYEEDPLRNYRALVTLGCKGCGWSEIVPVESPPPLSDEDKKVLGEAGSFRAKDKLEQMRAYQNAAGGLLNPSAIGQDALRQFNKSSVMGQLYGAGPSLMKSLLSSGKIGMVSGITVRELPALAPKRGQELADSIWKDYEELDHLRKQAQEDRGYVEAYRVREQALRDVATQMAKQIDKQVLDTIYKPGDMIRVAPAPKYAASPPPAPKLDRHDQAEMSRMIDEAYTRSGGDPSKLQGLLAQVREFFR